MTAKGIIKRYEESFPPLTLRRMRLVLCLNFLFQIINLIYSGSDYGGWNGGALHSTNIFVLFLSIGISKRDKTWKPTIEAATYFLLSFLVDVIAPKATQYHYGISVSFFIAAAFFLILMLWPNKNGRS